MNWDVISAVGEVVGSIAVVVTLVYLAVQIRQNTESLRMTAELDVSQQTAEFAARVRAQPDIVRIRDLVADDPTRLTDNEIAQFRWVLVELFCLYEGQYHVFQKGHISESSWSAKANMLRGLLASRIVFEWWRERMCPLSDEFFNYIDNSLDTNESLWKFRRIGELTRKYEGGTPDKGL